MVTDFFYPGFGGVESHIYNLSVCLIRRGHKVVVVTRSYGNRRGVRYLTSGVKVYYLPFHAIEFGPGAATMPTILGSFPIFRNIFLRERIEILHGHQATSTLMHEAFFHARTMGIRAVFTDHSLFGFADAACIHINKVMKWSLSDVDHVISVSHTGKENTALRAAVDPSKVSVIPNSVDATLFTPNPAARKPITGSGTETELTIVVVTRLVYRKGVDLLVDVIPEICRRFPQVKFVIGGDGPRKVSLEEMREQYRLFDRIEFLGAVPHSEVRNVLNRGHIFLNTSLTEAFCIAILEAACCGLFVVSTNVGGVPEVLPSNMVRLADANAEKLVDAVSDVIPHVRHVDPQKFHEEIASMYSWSSVAERTEKVYRMVISNAVPSLVERFRRFYGAGKLFGKLAIGLVAAEYLLWRFLEWWSPRDEIDEALDFSFETYESMKRGGEL
jgi:phosphatidylinositol N-acetylglucosaminyltransferase subunit A